MAIERDGSVRARKVLVGSKHEGLWQARYKYKGQWHSVSDGAAIITYDNAEDARTAAINHVRSLPVLAEAAHLPFLPMAFEAGARSVSQREFVHMHPRHKRVAAWMKARNLAGHMAVAQFHTMAAGKA